MKLALVRYSVVLDFMLLLSLMAAHQLVLAENLQVPTLCRSGEQIFFSCHINEKNVWFYEEKLSGKMVSLCGSRDLTPENGYIQLRLGTKNKMFLSLPKELAQTQQKFSYWENFRWQDEKTHDGIRIVTLYSNAGHAAQELADGHDAIDTYEIATDFVPKTKEQNRKKEFSFHFTEARAVNSLGVDARCSPKGVIDRLKVLQNLLPCDSHVSPEMGGCQK